ncbi:MBOAT-2 domain-containing protein [Mycena kentingensis (nom. inval.)]|nr:MBOAT-2 domain-containing protein [Mycena kentingensis (nom. inval.)]
MSIDDLRRSADHSALIVLSRLCAAFVAIYYAALVVSRSMQSVTSRVPLVDYYIGALLWISLVAASDHILLTDVQRELYVLGEKPEVDAALQKRMVWAGRLLGDRRALGWVHEERQSTPPRPAMSRPRFVASRLLQAIGALVLAETVNAYNELYTPALYPDGPSLAPTKILLFAIPLRVLHASTRRPQRRARRRNPPCPPNRLPIRRRPAHAALLPPKLLGPRMAPTKPPGPFPPLPLLVPANLVQQLLTAHGKFLAHKLLRLRRGSVASAYTQLYAAFLISRFMHYLHGPAALGRRRDALLRAPGGRH